jgi:phosphoglycerate dehydrogenase-like enzyme
VKILVTVYSPFDAWRIPPDQFAALQARFPRHTFVRADSDGEALAPIADADVVFGARLTPAHLAAASRLRWVHSHAAGVGAMLFPAMVDSPVVITNSSGVASVPIAEHVIALTLMMRRNLTLAWRRQGERVWAQNEFFHAGAPRTLSGARVLIVGLGSIGAATAKLAAAFGARVRAIRRHPGEPPDGVGAVLAPAALHDELPEADVVVVAAPQTKETTHLIGARELALMQDGAVLVNVSRGKLVDEQALAAELARGRLQAALDVFEHEPLDPGSPLWHSARTVITPHISGLFDGYWPAVVDLFSDNLRRFAAGEPLLNVVDKHAGY